jgi:DNA-binding NtrC family response regulator
MRVAILKKTDDHSLSVIKTLSMKTGLYYEIVETPFVSPDFNLLLIDDEFTPINSIDKLDNRLPSILFVTKPIFENAVIALRRGVKDIIQKPITAEKLWESISFVSPSLNNNKFEWIDKIVGISRAIQEIKSIIRNVAKTDLPVLIIGENGTEVDIVARAIHELSTRANGPFININCTSIPSDFIASEIFGKPGIKEGIIEKARNGTLFLEEITALSENAQIHLLHLLEKGTLPSEKGETPRTMDVRIIASSSFDISSAVKRNTFREDLYLRLSIFPIYIPPLRERLEDIEPLLTFLLRELGPTFGKKAKFFSPGAIGMLKNYQWPGNIKELKSVVEQVLILLPKDKEVITEDDLPLFLERRSEERKRRFLKETIQKKLSVDEYIKAFIETFEKEYTDKEIASLLGVTPKTIWDKRRKWGMLRRGRR